MTRKPAAALFGLSILGWILPLPGADGPKENGAKRSFEVTSTERVTVQPGAAIRLVDSYGYLTVEGWDEPVVEITVTKSTDRFYEAEKKEEAMRRLELIRVVTERRSETELSITTIRASRHGTWAPPLPTTTKAGVAVEYQIHVPRASRLAIHHSDGYVIVSNVAGDVEATSGSGDIVMMLPDPDKYSIDAQTRFGTVVSDFGSAGRRRFLKVGERLKVASSAPSHRVYARIGRGSITIKEMPVGASAQAGF